MTALLRQLASFAALGICAATALAQDKPAAKPAAPAAPAATPAAAPAAVPANPWVEKANKAVAASPGTEDLGPTLLPAIAAMTPSPPGAEAIDAAMLLSPKSKDWTKAAAWAQAEPQKKALEALAAVTDPKKKMLLALPYGTQGVNPAWVKAGLWVELPSGQYLQGMKPHYIKGVERLISLVNVEVTRLAEAGQCDKAMELLVQWLRLSRSMIERETALERCWAAEQMLTSCERIRDVAYVYRDKMTAEILANIAVDLDERLVKASRHRLPVIDGYAAEQLIAATIREKGNPDDSKFALVLARVSSADRPLMLFSQAAHYRELAKSHAGWFDSLDQLKKVMNGWANRWAVENLQDKMLKQPSDFAKMDKARFAIIDLAVKGIEPMEALRLKLLSSLAATRTSLGVVAYERKMKSWPPNISAIAPQFVKKLDEDVYNYDERFKNYLPFKYLLPMTGKPKNEREEPKPHEVTVVLQESSGGTGGSGASGTGGAITLPAGMGSMNVGPAALSAFKNFRIDPANPPDAAKLKEMFAQSAAASKKLTEADVTAVQAGLKVMIDGGMTPDNIEEKMKAAALPAGAVEKLGFDPQKLFEALAKFVAGAASGPKARAAFDAAKAGTLTLQQAQEYADESAAAMTRPDLVDPLAEQYAAALKSPMGPMIAQTINSMSDQAASVESGSAANAAPDASAGPSFTVSFNQKDCLVYSIGPDGRDDRAATVGPGGNDILYWPPVLTLRRQHGSN